MTDNLVGKTLADRYHILELIGTGGMASVYKAQCELLKRDVAVKVLRDSVKDDETALASFKQEAQAAAKLSHNNIVQVFDVGEVDGMDYMVMELVEGITLKKYITENGKLPWQEACDLAIQIAQALDAAHSKGVVHRDIKPQNILVTEEKVLKVADFGIAKAATSETVVMGDNNAMGSAHYISPEQARGGFTDARSDIYSLGVVLFEMLTGRVPFDAESAVAVALMHIEKRPPSVLDFCRSVPNDVASIVAKAISKEQSLRYQSAEDMISDLTAVLENRPVEVSEPDLDFEEDMGATRKFRIPEEEISRRPRRQKSTAKTRDKKKSKTPDEKAADRNATIMALLTVVILFFAGFGIWSFISNGATAAVEVPEFINMSKNDAVKIAAERGLIINELKTDVSDEVPKDHVMWQDPAPGTEVYESETVFIIISEGSSKGDIEVPDVTGASIDDAKQILKDEGLSYEIEIRPSKDVPLNYVITQSPSKKTRVEEGYKVTLFISSGAPAEAGVPVSEEKVIVPSLLGYNKDEAEKICEQYDFTLAAIQTDNEQPRGTIINQNPQAGAPADAGSQITVVISTGEVDAPITDETEDSGAEPTAIPDEDEEKPEKTEKPVPEDEKVKTKEYTFEIPGGTGTVDVKITADGDTVYEKTNNWGDTVSIDVSGKDKTKVVVFLDGRIKSEEYVEFN